MKLQVCRILRPRQKYYLILRSSISHGLTWKYARFSGTKAIHRRDPGASTAKRETLNNNIFFGKLNSFCLISSVEYFV